MNFESHFGWKNRQQSKKHFLRPTLPSFYFLFCSRVDKSNKPIRSLGIKPNIIQPNLTQPELT